MYIYIYVHIYVSRQLCYKEELFNSRREKARDKVIIPVRREGREGGLFLFDVLTAKCLF